MSPTHGIMLAAVALLCACATPALPPVDTPAPGGTPNSCGEALTTPLGEFVALEKWLSWRSHTDMGPQVGLDYDILLEPFQRDDKLDTFTGLTDGPQLWVIFDSRLERWDKRGREREPRFLEARIGESVMRENLRGSVVAHIQSKALADLLVHEGDLELTLLDGGGAVLQRRMVPRTMLPLVEETLRQLQARVITNLADKEHRCRVVPEIVMVNSAGKASAP